MTALDRYAGFRHTLDIAVLSIGGAVLLTCVMVLMWEYWKNNHRRR